MPYQYLAYTEEGDPLRGTAQAPSAAVVERMLWQNNYYIVDVSEVPPPVHWRDQFPSIFGVKVKDVIIFTRQLATLVNSGVPLLPAMVLLREQVSHPAFHEALTEITHEIESGSSVSTALRRYPLIFPEIYSRMVDVGERTGRLELVLDQVATYIEKQQAILGRIRGALMYPLFILAVAAAVIVLLVTVALPALLGIFKEFHAELPWTTRLLVTVTDFAKANFATGLLLASLTAILLTAYARTASGRRRIHAFVLLLPFIGPVLIMGYLTNFTRSMAILLRAGIALPEIMDLTTATVGNVVVRESFEQVKTGLLQGHGLALPLEQDPRFPRLVSQMVKVGEESGALDSILNALADFYEKEADRSISDLTAKIEPTLILVIGVIVGFIALSVITPMYSLIGAVVK